MPIFVDPIRMKSGSTDVLVASTDGLFGGAASLPSTVSHTLVSTTDVQTLENKTLGAGSVFATTDSTGATTIPNYGLTRIAASAAASTYTLAAPQPGVMKFLYVAANSTNITINASTSVAIGTVLTTDAYRKIVFSRPATVTLLGITTAQWDVLSVGTTFAGTTALPTFTT
jgi:hypothetical protein